jgi:7-cyano-7-deazaguanine synthase
VNKWQTADGELAVVLVSGGIDSATILELAQRQGFDVFALTFDYGQRHRAEIQAARRVAQGAGVTEHRVVSIDPTVLAGSALTSNLAVPKNRTAEEMSSGIPITYVPARNSIFLAYALAWCEGLAAWNIFIGVNALDHAGYPDCRPEYIAAFEQLANVATKQAVEGSRKFKIHAPLINLTKEEIIEQGTALGVDYSCTSTCYAPADAGEACGACDACILRRDGFAACGIPDPNERTTR